MSIGKIISVSDLMVEAFVAGEPLKRRDMLYAEDGGLNNGEHLAETPQITGGNSAVRMGERHRMISAYDNAVRTGEQPLMTKSVIFAR